MTPARQVVYDTVAAKKAELVNTRIALNSKIAQLNSDKASAEGKLTSVEEEIAECDNTLDFINIETTP